MGQKAIVAGATGLIGKELVRRLLAHSAYDSVTLLVRKRLGMEHAKLVQHVVDFDRLEEAAASMEFAEAQVFCTLGTTIKKAGSQEAFRRVDELYPLALARIAQRGGAAKLLIVTAMGASRSSSVFYNRVKGDVEHALEQLGLRELHIFRPSLLLGEREEFRLGERIGMAAAGGLSFLFAGPLRKYKPIEAGAVAEAMVRAASAGAAGSHVYESDEIARMAGR